MDAPELDRSRAVWRTSSYTNNGDACVEVATNLPGVVAVRDSRDRNGPVLVFTSAQWREFTAGIRAGELGTD